jgi:hypothetical protein
VPSSKKKLSAAESFEPGWRREQLPATNGWCVGPWLNKARSPGKGGASSMPPTQRSAKRLMTDRDDPLRRDETTRERSARLLARYITTGARGGKRVTKKAGKPFITKRSRTLVLAPWTRMRVRYSQPVPDALSRLCSALPFPCMSSLAGPVCFGIYGNWQPAGSGANGTGNS